MRILYHHRTQAEDAQGVHIYEMIQAFRDLGHDLDLVALVELDHARERKVRGSTWERIARVVPNIGYELMELAYNVYGYRRLAQRIRSARPDLIYERYSLNTFCGIWASRAFRIPIALEVNAPLCYEQQKFGKLTFRSLARFSERWICSNSSQTLVVSGVMKTILEKEGVPPEKLVVVPNGINPHEFHPHVSPDEVVCRYRLKGHVVIGFVGWFRKWHGLEMLLEVFHSVKLADQGVRLLLIGDGPAGPDLRRFVDAHGLSGAVMFTGSVDRKTMPAHIAALDIALQPSVTEYASPMKIFEYMGMAKCILAPDQPNIREILTDRETAYLFQPGDRESFETALLELIGAPDVRRMLGERARQAIFNRQFLWRSNAQKVLDVLFEKQAPTT